MTEPKAEYMTESTEPFHWKWVESMRRWVVYENRGFNMATQCHYFEVVCTCGTAEKAAQVCESLIQSRSTDAPEATGGADPKLIRKLWKAVEQLDDVSMMSSVAVQKAIEIIEASTPRQEAPIEAELQTTLRTRTEYLHMELKHMGESMEASPSFLKREIELFEQALSALSSRSGMVSVSRECAEDVATHYTARILDSATLLNGPLLTETARAIVGMRLKQYEEVLEELKQSLEQSE